MSKEQPQPHEKHSRLLALGLSLGMGVVTVILRVVPHPPNLTGVGAVGLFGGGRLRPWQALALPLLVMLASDTALWVMMGFDPLYSPLHISRAFVYPSVLVYTLIGWALLSGKASLLRVAGASLLGSLQFFLLTN